jgi:endoglucanase
MGPYPTGVAYRGINLSGAEYGEAWDDKFDGWNGGTYYRVPDPNELTYHAAQGFNAVRLPIAWERLQHDLKGPFDADYLGKIVHFVTDATAGGWLVVVDLHNYGRYATGAYDPAGKQVASGWTQHVMNDGVLGTDDLVDVWVRLVKELPDHPNVVFGLMNEPHFPKATTNVTSNTWFSDIVQTVINAIRAAGAGQLILVPNTWGSDVSHWDTQAHGGGDLDSVAALAVSDPADNHAFDMHCYQGQPSTATSYADQVVTVTQWAHQNKKKLFLSEMGVEDSDPNGAVALGGLLSYLDDNSDVWIGWTPWNLSPYTVTVRDQYGNVGPGPQLPWYRPHLTQPHVDPDVLDLIDKVLEPGRPLVGVTQDGGGLFLVGGVLHRVPPRSPILTLIATLADQGVLGVADAAQVKEAVDQLGSG